MCLKLIIRQNPVILAHVFSGRLGIADPPPLMKMLRFFLTLPLGSSLFSKSLYFQSNEMGRLKYEYSISNQTQPLKIFCLLNFECWKQNFPD